MCLTVYASGVVSRYLLQRDKIKTMPLHSQHHAVLHDTQID